MAIQGLLTAAIVFMHDEHESVCAVFHLESNGRGEDEQAGLRGHQAIVDSKVLLLRSEIYHYDRRLAYPDAAFDHSLAYGKYHHFHLESTTCDRSQPQPGLTVF